jgi:hypothetical protein
MNIKPQWHEVARLANVTKVKSHQPDIYSKLCVATVRFLFVLQCFLSPNSTTSMLHMQFHDWTINGIEIILYGVLTFTQQEGVIPLHE